MSGTKTQAQGVTDTQLVAVVLQSDPILSHVQRELRRLRPDLTVERLRQILRDEIIRHEVVASPQTAEAQEIIQRVNSLRASGFTTTQTMRAVSSGEAGADGHEDPNEVLREDKRLSSGGG